MQSAEDSSQASRRIFEITKPALELLLGKGNATEHFARKLAHFLQFGLLGCELALLLITTKKLTLQGMANCMFFGLCVAVMDETIQIFSMRGPQISDVLIDFVGLCAGIIVTVSAHKILHCFKK